MNWKMLTKLEPKLKLLEREIKAVKDDGSTEWFCANRVWYENFKEPMSELVGWEAGRYVPEEVTTSQAYEIAYRHLYDLLPPCRNCNCL